MPQVHPSWRALYWALLIAGLLILLSWAAKARADDISGSYIATAYGPPLTGGVSRDGQHWFRFDGLKHVAVAHVSIPRGTRIVLYIPPQAAGATYAMRTWGAMVSQHEDGTPLTVSDACYIDPTHPCPTSQLDLSYVLLLRAGFCAPEQDPYRCMALWGRRQVYMWSVSPTPDRPRSSFRLAPLG